jgi:hypothetical protein
MKKFISAATALVLLAGFSLLPPPVDAATATINYRNAHLRTNGNLTVGGTLTVTGAQTMTGATTFTASPVFPVAGASFKDSAGDHTTTLKQNSDEAANRTLNIPALGGNDTLMTLGTNQSITGVKTFTDAACIHTMGTGSDTFKSGGVIYSTGTSVNTGANTDETDGGTKSVAANSLSANGKALRYRVWGTTGATGNNKTIKLYFGGTEMYSTGAVAANAKPWFLEMTIIRTGAGTQTVLINGSFNDATVAKVATATKDETTALIVKNTMTNGTAADSDCTTAGAMLEVLP